jgi:hypothetical protein
MVFPALRDICVFVKQLLKESENQAQGDENNGL